jgi:putative ABC transport system permease protein
MRDLLWDLRHALGSFRGGRGVAVVAVAVLAIGIGANTAIFSVVHEVLLRPLPYPDDERLVVLRARDSRRVGEDGVMPATPADFRDWKAASRSYAGMAASDDGTFNLTGEGEPEMLTGYHFDPEVLSVLGVAPALGRAFAPTDGADVVLLGHDLWQRRFAGDPAVVGKAVRLNGKPHTVLGVMPEGFDYPRRTQIWSPLVLTPEMAASRTQRFIRVIARLRPGVTVEQASAELATIAAGIAAAHPATHATTTADVFTLRERTSGDVRTPLLVLAGAVGFLLLLACANVAALLVARTASRQRELAIRVALGATRGRLVRQLLTETVLLALAGGAAGLFLAWWATGALVEMFPKQLANISIPDVKSIPISLTVLGFSVAASAIAALLCGLPAAIAATGADVEPTLRETAPGEGRRALRLRRFLVAGELALATLIAVGAALLMKSSLRLANTDLGFDGRNVLSARMFLAEDRYPDQERQRRMVDDVLARLRARPEVASAGAVSTLPLSGWSANLMFALEGRPDEDHDAGFLVADPGYFQAMGIPLLRGRMFSSADGPGAPKVLIVDETFSRRYFPGGDALGRRIDVGTRTKPDLREIVGVVGAVLEEGPTVEAKPLVYSSFTQRGWALVALVVEARRGDPTALAGITRAAVWEVDDDQPLSYIHSVDELRADVAAPTRVVAFLFTFFAATALILGALGVYGVTAYSVARRTREIGVRMALGARRRDVLRWVVRGSAPLAAAGLAAGLGLALALGRVLSGMLHGVSATDPAALGLVCLALAACAALATWLPARRATRVDPAVALRGD